MDITKRYCPGDADEVSVIMKNRGNAETSDYVTINESVFGGAKIPGVTISGHSGDVQEYFLKLVEDYGVSQCPNDLDIKQ